MLHSQIFAHHPLGFSLEVSTTLLLFILKGNYILTMAHAAW